MTENDIPHILVVEDDPSLSEWIGDYLASQGYKVSFTDRGDEAVRLIKDDIPDLVLLDVMLPELDGFEVCKQVRDFYQNPILILTARKEETDELLGFDLGADDYLSKPVKPRILLARIRRLLKRDELNQEVLQVLQFGHLKIDATSRTVIFMGERLDLSSNEFEALWLLAKNAGEIVSRDHLMQSLLKLEYDGVNRAIDLMISRLRKKLNDDSSKPSRIKTIRGKGYLFATDAWDDA